VQNGFEGTEQEWLTSLNGDSAYDIAVTSEGFQGTKEQWLASLRGAQGPKGEPGDRGQIGFDGPVGPQGPGGKSLYQIYVDIENEYNRTPLELHEWFALQGRDAYMVYRDEEIRLGRIPLEKSAWLESLNGDNAYDIAKKWPHNFTGTEAQWLASLKGVKGDKGDKGDTGTPALIRTGTTTVVDNVNFASVTITDPDINGYQSVNFAIPRGPKGDIGDPSTVPGPEGKSAFQSWYESYPEGEAPYDSELMWTISVLENDYTFAKDRMGFTGTREDWIESLQGPPGPTGASGGNSQATNLILNGAFDIWQRGTSFTVAANGSAYTADRWRVSGTNSSTVTKIASANINEYNTPNWLKVEAPAATVGKYVELETTIESADAQIFYGQSITYSFDYVSIGANGGNDAMFDLFIEVPNSKDNWTTVGARTKITDFYAWAGNVAGEYGRIYLPAGADKGFKLIFKLKHSNNQQNINFQIGKIQLEVTPVDQTTGDFLQEPSAFRRKGITIAGELAECQRYYQRVSRSAANVMYVHGLQATGTTAYVSMPLAVPMFKVPTCGYSGVRWKNSVDERALTSMPVKAGSDNKIVEITPTWATTSAAAFTPGMLQSTTTTSYVEFTAEI
jgi:hypothetical protein